MTPNAEIQRQRGDKPRHRLNPLCCNRLTESGDTVTDMGGCLPLLRVLHNHSFVTNDTYICTCETHPERDTHPKHRHRVTETPQPVALQPIQPVTAHVTAPSPVSTFPKAVP